MKWALLALTVICVGVVTFGTWLLGSPGGTIWLFNQVTSRVEGLTMTGVGGTLTDQVTFDVLRYESPSLDLVAVGGKVRLDIDALFNRRIVLPLVSAASLDVLTRTTTDAEPADVGFSMPWMLDVNSLDLARLSVTVGEGAPLVFDGVAVEAQLFKADLKLGLATATHELAALGGDFRMRFEDGYPFAGSLTVHESALLPDGFDNASASFEGSTRGLAIDGRVGPAEIRAELSFEGATTLAATASAASFRLDGFDVERASADVRGQLDDLAITFATVVVHPVGRAEIDAGLRLQPDLLLIESATATGSQGHLTLAGSVDLPARELRAAFDGVLLDKPIEGNAVISGRDRSDLGGTLYVHQDKNWAVLTAAPSAGITVNGGLTQLADVYPGLSGDVSFAGQFSLEDQQFEADMFAGRLAYDEWEARDLVLASEGVMGGALSVNLAVPALTRGVEKLGNGTLAYAGTLAAGIVSAAWQHAFAALEVTLERETDSLRLTSGLVRFQGEDWRLTSPAAIVPDATVVSIGDQCWTAAPASVCFVGGQFGAETGQVAVNVSALTLGALQLNTLAMDVSYRTADEGIEALVNTLANLGLGGYEGELRFAGRASANRVVLDDFALDAIDLALRGRAEYALAEERLTAEISGTRLGRRVAAIADVVRTPFEGTISVDIGGTQILRILTTDQGVNASLSMPDLAWLAPVLGGSLNGEGQFDAQGLSWQMQLMSPALSVGSNRVTAVALQAQGRGSTIAAARLSTDDWQAGAYSLGSGGLVLSGDPAAFIVGLNWQYAGNRVDVNTQLVPQENLLTGQLMSASIVGAQQSWVMDPGARFELASGRGRVDDHCWRHLDASLCLAGVTFAEDALDFSLVLADAPVRLRDIYYAPETRLDGRLSAAVAGRIESLSTSPLVNANFSVRVPDGELAYFDQALAWTLSGKGNIANNLAEAELIVESDAANRFRVTAGWPSIFEPERFQLQSSLTSNSMGVITAFVPQLDRAAGTINAAAQLDTRGDGPIGRFSLDVGEGASVVVPIAGISLEEVTLHAEGDEEMVTLAFGARSGDGQIQGKGQVTAPLSAERELELIVSGENFVALQRPELSVIASPALQFRYQGTGTAQLAGHLDVTGGNFRLQDLGVQPRRISPDVTVLSRKIPNQAFYQLDLGVGLTIDNFAVDMYGLRGKVDGGLSLVQRPRMPRRLIGAVNLREGSFARYGQNFAVERGRLIFAGPINNPIVDVVSSRSIKAADDEIKVSLLLSGPANNIRSRLVAVPAMSEAQALSYLVLGRSLRGASAADGQSISLAALALGVKGVAPVTEQLKSALGLTELTLESRGVDGTSVIAGKQISPGLYVEYNYDVLGRIGGILFNYQLSDKFSLETRTGADNSMQLIYRLE